MSETKDEIKLNSLYVTKNYTTEGYKVEVDFTIGGNGLKLEISPEDSQSIIDACAVIISEASARAAKRMSDSVSAALALAAPKEEPVIMEEPAD